MVGDGHQPNSWILLISPYKDSLLKVGWPFSILRLLIMAVVSCFMRTTEGFQWIDGSMGISGPNFLCQAEEISLSSHRLRVDARWKGSGARLIVLFVPFFVPLSWFGPISLQWARLRSFPSIFVFGQRVASWRGISEFCGQKIDWTLHIMIIMTLYAKPRYIIYTYYIILSSYHEMYWNVFFSEKTGFVVVRLRIFRLFVSKAGPTPWASPRPSGGLQGRARETQSSEVSLESEAGYSPWICDYAIYIYIIYIYIWYIIWYILLYSCYIIYDLLIIDKTSNKHAYTNHISSIYHTKLTSAEMNTKQKECLSNCGASAPFEFEVLKEILDS